jgi:hypothetical protein
MQGQGSWTMRGTNRHPIPATRSHCSGSHERRRLSVPHWGVARAVTKATAQARRALGIEIDSTFPLVGCSATRLVQRDVGAYERRD